MAQRRQMISLQKAWNLQVCLLEDLSCNGLAYCSVDAFNVLNSSFLVIGNQFAASGNLQMAVKYFTDAIKYNPKEYK